MANTYYDSDLTGEQIEQALEAIDGVIVPANNGKVLAINNGKIEARSVQWDADLGPKSITENGTYNPASDNLDGYSQVTVNVSGGGGTTDANHVTYNSSETYDSGTVGAALNEQRNTLTQLEDNLVSETLVRTGATNTGNPITAGTYFYLDGVLSLAIQYIDTGATFTNSNKKTVTAGEELTALNNSLKGKTVRLNSVLTFSSTEASQTVNVGSQYIGYILVGAIWNSGTLQIGISSYITDMIFNPATADFTITRTSAPPFAGAPLDIILMKI